MDKIIDYVNKHEIEDMVAAIIKSGKDIKEVIHSVKMSRVEYQTKSQHLQWALEEYLPKKEDNNHI